MSKANWMRPWFSSLWSYPRGRICYADCSPLDMRKIYVTLLVRSRLSIMSRKHCEKSAYFITILNKRQTQRNENLALAMCVVRLINTSTHSCLFYTTVRSSQSLPQLLQWTSELVICLLDISLFYAILKKILFSFLYFKSIVCRMFLGLRRFPTNYEASKRIDCAIERYDLPGRYLLCFE